ncbi:MAG: hypothetical protein U9N83_13660, partial [Thermodesulfobacteriota bacterium]|nr:hypothetical protein [Thermodesulfobacteriota bacterium]
MKTVYFICAFISIANLAFAQDTISKQDVRVDTVVVEKVRVDTVYLPLREEVQPQEQVSKDAPPEPETKNK